MFVFRPFPGFVMHALFFGSLLQLVSAVQVGFAETDITPDVEGETPVWMAGYHPGRRATDVHDPLMCRAVVIANGDEKIALACVDLIGLQRPTVQRVREKLSGYKVVMVSSTHSHEGPDVIGIWGPSYIQRGVDEAYVDLVVDRTVQAIRRAEESLSDITSARFGVAEDESLIRDSRLPVVIDGKLRTLRFMSGEKTLGVVVVWNCHPEAMGADNTSLTADFVSSTVNSLKESYDCPVAYFSGSLGGLMAPPRKRIFDSRKEELKEGEFQYAEKYGVAVADLAAEAIESDSPIELTPFRVAEKEIAVPVENKYYRAAAALKVLTRPSHEWLGSYEKWGEKLLSPEEAQGKKTAVLTEVAAIRMGQLTTVCVPGEIYPELTLGKVQDPVEKNADFPDAAVEPSIAALFPDERKLIIGLANDELGYFLPKRQWDSAPPFAYGKKATQYGEINSCGPEAGPIIMSALRDVAETLNNN